MINFIILLQLAIETAALHGSSQQCHKQVHLRLSWLLCRTQYTCCGAGSLQPCRFGRL